MGRIEIEEDRCKGCELCVAACPRSLIQISRQINKLGYHSALTHPEEHASGKGCTGCVLCALVCPETAINVYR